MSKKRLSLKDFKLAKSNSSNELEASKLIGGDRPTLRRTWTTPPGADNIGQWDWTID